MNPEREVWLGINEQVSFLPLKSEVRYVFEWHKLADVDYTATYTLPSK